MTEPNRLEIEHKFLVTNDGWRGQTSGIRYRQGYLAGNESCVVRVRVGGDKAYLTIKGKRVGHTRAEYEYRVPASEADEMIDTLCGDRVVSKTRYRIPFRNHVWEVDEFHGANAGLILAEIELEQEGEAFETPEWVGEDVSQDDRYTNARLAEEPWGGWGGR